MHITRLDLSQVPIEDIKPKSLIRTSYQDQKVAEQNNDVS